MNELESYLAFSAGHIIGTIGHHYLVRPYFPDIPPFMISMPVAMAVWYGYKRFNALPPAKNPLI